MGVHVIAPAAALEGHPLANPIALRPLAEAAAAWAEGKLATPSGAARLAVTIDGTESEDVLAALEVPCFLVWEPAQEALMQALVTLQLHKPAHVRLLFGINTAQDNTAQHNMTRKNIEISTRDLTIKRRQGAEEAPVLALLEIAAGLSRVHASRRVFELLAEHNIDIPVIHHRAFPAGGRIRI